MNRSVKRSMGQKKRGRLGAALLVLLCCLLTACRTSQPAAETAADGAVAPSVDVLQFREPEADALVAVFETSAGEFSAVLYPQAAPQAVQNFVTLARQGAYNGLNFHRVIADFIIQSGDTDGNGGQSIWGNPFAAEVSDAVHHYTGALAMAGGSANRSQFFVVNCQTDSVPDVLQEQMRQLGWEEDVITAYAEVGGAPYLDMHYTVFGQVFYGMDTVRAVGGTAGQTNTPADPALLQTVTITTYADWCSSHPEVQPAFYTPAAPADDSAD